VAQQRFAKKGSFLRWVPETTAANKAACFHLFMVHNCCALLALSRCLTSSGICCTTTRLRVRLVESVGDQCDIEGDGGSSVSLSRRRTKAMSGAQLREELSRPSSGADGMNKIQSSLPFVG